MKIPIGRNEHWVPKNLYDASKESKIIDRGELLHGWMKMKPDPELGPEATCCIAFDLEKKCCSIYDQRPQVCRDFNAGCDLCHKAILVTKGSSIGDASSTVFGYPGQEPDQKWQQKKEYARGCRRFKIDDKPWGPWICHWCYQSASKVRKVRHSEWCMSRQINSDIKSDIKSDVT